MRCCSDVIRAQPVSDQGGSSFNERGWSVTVVEVRRFAKSVLRPLTQQWVSRDSLVTDLGRLGVERGGTLLVHSSISSLGYVHGGVETVLVGLIEAVGQGTLVLPTLTFGEVNRGRRDFDVRTSASQVGVLSETLRRRPGVVRSLHPTHSVAAIGPAAEELIADHELASTPCGNETPYSRLMDRGGQVLLLGVGLRRNTCFHAVEALAGVPYLMRSEPEEFSITDAEGGVRRVPVRMHAPARKCRFDELEEELAENGVLRRGTVGQARSLLIEGRAFRDYMLSKLAADPEYVLKRECTPH